MGDQAQLRGLAGAAGWAGLCSGLQQSPSSSSRHRGGSAEPGTACRGLGAQVGTAARSESYQDSISWLGHPNTASPPALSEKHFKFSLPNKPASIPPPNSPCSSPDTPGLRDAGDGSGGAGHCWEHHARTAAPASSPCPCGSVLSPRGVSQADPSSGLTSRGFVSFLQAALPVTCCELSTHHHGAAGTEILGRDLGASTWSAQPK